MHRQQKRVVNRFEAYLHNKKMEIMQSLYFEADKEVRRYPYDPHNKVFDVNPNDWMYFSTLRDIHTDLWLNELDFVKREMYNNKNLNKQGLLEYLKGREEEVNHEFNKAFCALLLEGHYGLDKAEIKTLLTKKEINNPIKEAINIITNIKTTENEKNLNYYNILVADKRNWFQSILDWGNTILNKIKNSIISIKRFKVFSLCRCKFRGWTNCLLFRK
jgi:hypothetical protein